MKPTQQLTFPNGADRNLLARFAKQASQDRQKRFKQAHDLLVRETKM